MGRDPKRGRVIKFWGRVTLVRSCCMVIINYFDTFNVKLIGYPLPRNVFLRINRTLSLSLVRFSVSYEDIARRVRFSHVLLFCVIISKSACLFFPPPSKTTTFTLFMSFSTVSTHVVFVLPLGFLTYLWNSLRALFAGVFSGNLAMCPYQFSLLLFTSMLHGFCFMIWYNFSFEIFFGHFTFSICLSRFL